MSFVGRADPELAVVGTSLASRQGPRRDENQDRVVCSPPLLALADGMGGAAGGADAAAAALHAFADAVGKPSSDDPGFPSPQWTDRVAALDPSEVGGLLCSAVGAADAAVREMASATARAGAACTLTGLLFFDDQLHLAHVGDSRLYLLRHGQLSQLSEDHTVLSELHHDVAANSDMGRRLAGVLSRSIGGRSPEAEPYLMSFPAELGDRVLLCSDGVHSVLESHHLTAVLDGALSGAADRVIDAAWAAGTGDDATVLVADVGPMPESTD